MSKITFTEVGATPTPPAVGQVSMYVKSDEVLYILDSAGIETPLGSSAAITQLVGEATGIGPGVTTVTLDNTAVISKVLTGFTPGPNSTVLASDSILQAIQKLQAQTSGTIGAAITQLTGDVTAVGPGSVPATVAFVGGSSAANVHLAELAANAATSINTASTIVKRDASGNFAANIITATLNGIANNVSGIVAIVNGGTNSSAALSNNRIMQSFGGAIIEAPAITPARALISDANGIPTHSVTTAIELSYVNGVTSSIQAQLNAITGSAITALVGDVVATGPGSVTSTIQSHVVTNAKLAQMNAFTVKANITGSTANAADASLGTVTEATSSVLVLTGWSHATIGSPTIQVVLADATHSGYLSSTDWNTFNSTSGAAITALTGDGTATGPGSVAFTLATVNSNVGTFGSSTAIPTVTVNAKGLVTAVSTNAVIAPAGTLTGTVLASNVVTSSLTAVGTIVTGVWNGTAITGSFIGTNTVANTNLALMPAFTVKSNTGAIPATPVDNVLGTVTEATSSVLILTGWSHATLGSPTIQVVQADATHSGYLSSTDWNTFNTTSGAAITALTGDATATGPGSVAITLATVNSNVGTFGSSTSIPTFTVNAKGLITAASSNVVIAPAGTLTGTTLASNVVNSSLQNLGVQNAILNMGGFGISNTGTILPAADTTYNIGQVGSRYNKVYFFFLQDNGDVTAIQIPNRNLYDNLGVSSIAWSARNLNSPSNATQLTWANTGVTINTNLNMNNTNIDNVAQLGIGTLTPGAGTSIDIVNSTGSTQVVQQTGYGASTGHRGRYANGTVGSPTAAVATNILEFISGRGYGATGFAAASTGAITIVAEATFTDTSMPTSITMATTSTGSVTNAVALKLQANGQLSLPKFYTTAGLLLNDASGNVTSSALTNGQLYIGSTGAAPVAATITAGTGIVVTNGAGTITLSTSGTNTVVTKTANYTILSTDSIIFVDTSGGAFTLTLPAPGTLTGKIYRIIDVAGTLNTNNLTLARSSTEKIEGLAASKVLQTNWGWFEVTTNGTDWFVG